MTEQTKTTPSTDTESQPEQRAGWRTTGERWRRLEAENCKRLHGDRCHGLAPGDRDQP
jgi:hypothetical protein